MRKSLLIAQSKNGIYIKPRAAERLCAFKPTTKSTGKEFLAPLLAKKTSLQSSGKSQGMKAKTRLVLN